MFKSVFLSSAIAAMSAVSASAETSLVFGDPGPNRGSRAEAVTQILDEIEANSDLKIQREWGGSLFKAPASVPSISSGVVDLGGVIGIYFPNELTGYGVADLPLGNSDPWVSMKATDELMRTNASIQQQLSDEGLVFLGAYTTTAVNVACKNVAIRKAEDLKGVKLRGIGAYGKALNDFGANPVTLSVYKAYQALDSGLIDCTQGYSYVVKALKWDEQITSYTLLDWGQLGAIGILMNKDSFEALTPDQQAAIQAATTKLPDVFGELVEKDTQDAHALLREKNIEIIEISAEERQKLIDAGQPHIQDWIKRANASGLDGQAILDEYKALIAKYSKERDEKGYPWTR